MKSKIVIYQLLPRLFSNSEKSTVFNGNRDQNGCGKFNDISDLVLKELGNFGITHIWLTGIIRHATLSHYPEDGLVAIHPDIVKGNAGSPYAINDYYDVDPDLATEVFSRMIEFEQLVKRIHRSGLKVIIDFVPNHVSRSYHSSKIPDDQLDLGEGDQTNLSFSPSNNYYYFPGETLEIKGLARNGADRYIEFPAKATGNDVFRPDPDSNDWYETVKLNYGIDYRTSQKFFHPLPDTWIKMTEILLFWSTKGIDGFRCDMAGMVPVEFWQYAISQIKSDWPEILFIAELYEPSKYRDYLEIGFFDFLYDKVGLYDALRSVIEERSSTNAISKVWQSLEGLDNAMVRFLENHDEQRIASRFFASDPWKALPGMAVSAFLNQGPILIYSGQEVGERADGASGFSGDDGRTSIFDYTVMPEVQKWYNGGKCDGSELSEDQWSLRMAYSNILDIAQSFPVFANGLLYDLMWVNGDNPHFDKVFAFLRYGGSADDEVFLVVVSFSRSIRGTTIKIPEHALQVIGFEAKQRINIRDIEPCNNSNAQLLVSQIISIGLEVHFNKAGYALISLS